ncbi:hypothetical protein FBQ82_10160 [Anaerolineae bacterium CFX7]|nr:hypothetical protein [Anaerolineae bacterium CFX7]
MKTGTLIVVAITLATIGYHAIERVSAETLNIAFGVMCGVAASVPVTVGLMLALLRQRQTADASDETFETQAPPARESYRPASQTLPAPSPPQIIVLSPQGQFAPGQLPQNFPLQWNQTPNPFLSEHANAVDAREWRIIGEE